eukprot:TRINITY_DN3435_c0_g1_i1.p1 TRINITY_DN3435_c0_g1~~TRINITY_DN3435_c0_g1_i1.p1  ORF type:complete len:386 (+),score=75.22 TRINITY_DN3435_c0_g1_i1:84-1241(+)
MMSDDSDPEDVDFVPEGCDDGDVGDFGSPTGSNSTSKKRKRTSAARKDAFPRRRVRHREEFSSDDEQDAEDQEDQCQVKDDSKTEAESSSLNGDGYEKKNEIAGSEATPTPPTPVPASQPVTTTDTETVIPGSGVKAPDSTPKAVNNSVSDFMSMLNRTRVNNTPSPAVPAVPTKAVDFNSMWASMKSGTARASPASVSPSLSSFTLSSTKPAPSLGQPASSSSSSSLLQSFGIGNRGVPTAQSFSGFATVAASASPSTTLDSAAVSGETVSNTAPKEKVVEEEYEFAGEKVKIKKTVASGAPKARGLDAMLDSLQNKKKLSTMGKSQHDWDQFKDVNDLHDDLNKNTKDGYLGKVAFLKRSDDVEAEKAKNMRLKEMEKRRRVV